MLQMISTMRSAPPGQNQEFYSHVVNSTSTPRASIREMWVKIRAPHFPITTARSGEHNFSCYSQHCYKIHRVSTGESTFALVDYFHFDNVSKVCNPSNVSQSSEI